MSTATKSRLKPGTIVDKLGAVKAQVAELKKKEDSLRQCLIDSGITEVEGKLFRGSVSTYSQNRIDYAALLEYLTVDAKTIAKYTYGVDQVRVKVSARKTG